MSLFYRMSALATLLLVTSLALRCDAQEKGEQPKGKGEDAEKLTGTWLIVSQMSEGEETAPADLKNEMLKIAFTKGELAFLSGMGTRSKCSWVIDSSKRPKQITLTNIEPLKGEKSVGIYELDGDTLKLCIGPAEKDWPTKFEAKRDSGYVLHVLSREKSK